MSKAVCLALGLTFLVACSSDKQAPTMPLSLPVVTQDLHGAAASDTANGANFGTPVDPSEEVMPPGIVNTSRARGSAVFQLSGDGTELSYKLIVANIENAFQAHIHSAPAGVNGGIVVWLYPSTAPVPGPFGGGRLDGVIAEGTITAANLVGSLRGQPLSALIDLITSGNAYVNVHTNDGVGAVNTGPGDYPGGEMRGQLEHRGH